MDYITQKQPLICKIIIHIQNRETVEKVNDTGMLDYAFNYIFIYYGFLIIAVGLF